MLIYADFPVEITLLPTSITVNVTGMQTEQIFGVSIRDDEMLFCCSHFFWLRLMRQVFCNLMSTKFFFFFSQASSTALDGFAIIWSFQLLCMHGPQRMNSTDFGDRLNFPAVRHWGVYLKIVASYSFTIWLMQQGTCNEHLTITGNNYVAGTI